MNILIPNLKTHEIISIRSWKTVNSIIGRGKAQRHLRRVISLNQRPYQMLSIISSLILDQSSKISTQGKTISYFDYLMKPTQTCIHAKPTVSEEINYC